MPSRGELDRYADLIVQVGANVQPGQDVVAMGWVEHAPLVRAIAPARATLTKRILITAPN